MIDFWINTQNGIQFPENFERTFGEDYRTYVAEFEDFIRTNDREAVMGILPSLDRNHHRRLKRGLKKSACPDLVFVNVQIP